MVAQAANNSAVLLIDDYPDMLASSVMLLRLSGVDVTACGTADQAEHELSDAEQHHRHFCLMVSDWNLKDQNASALVEHACRLGIRVLVVTGSPMQVQDWIEHTASDHVRKAGIRIVTKGHDWMSAASALLQ